VSELEPERVRPLLGGALGVPYLHFVETASTQDVLRDGEYPHGAVAVAEHQTAGRGRSGRRWDDIAATALLFSVLLRPPSTAELPQLSLVAGLAVAAALEREAQMPMLVKWPNDVLGDGRKVAGILLEAAGGSVIGGIGINVNQEERDVPVVARVPATSLQILAGRTFDRGVVLAAVLVELERRYAAWLTGGLTALAPELEERNALHGSRVRVGGRAGTAGAIAPDGRLTIVLDRGDVVFVESGEVELDRGGTRYEV
jgi:BirA family transcriptional regulator, biotin operon repressor / biotin---[acetyl-CoA-carboxylase] ligase